jgi:hypothetical protein
MVSMASRELLQPVSRDRFVQLAGAGVAVGIGIGVGVATGVAVRVAVGVVVTVGDGMGVGSAVGLVGGTANTTTGDAYGVPASPGPATHAEQVSATSKRTVALQPACINNTTSQARGSFMSRL